MQHPFETRLAQIAWLVLASGACRPAESAPPTAIDVPPPSATGTSTIATGDNGAVVASAAPPPEPAAVCADYRAKAASDPNGPRAQNPTNVQRVGSPSGGEDVRARRIDDTKVECRIVWEHTASMETVMVAPTCCPQSRMTAPCPPPSPQKFPGERAKIEIAIVTNDAGLVSSTLAWNQFVREPPRHMCGRRPEGFASAVEVRATTTAGACLAAMAELEAASIAAFDRLARELVAHGASQSLVERARAAQRDEIRHAKTMRSLARRFGAATRVSTPRARPVRPLLAIAIENAVEGCVFETLGAIVATFQAARAADPVTREAFAKIADDERRHAALAWDVDVWLSARLTDHERAAVEGARRSALGALHAGSSSSDDDEAGRALGLPSPSERAALVRELDALLAAA